MVSALLTVLSLKMLAYTAVLVTVLVRLSVWRRRAQAAQQVAEERGREVADLRTKVAALSSRIHEMEAQAASDAAAAAARLADVQRKAAEARASLEGQAAAVMVAPVDEAHPVDFLRAQAGKALLFAWVIGLCVACVRPQPLPVPCPEPPVLTWPADPVDALSPQSSDADVVRAFAASRLIYRARLEEALRLLDGYRTHSPRTFADAQPQKVQR